MSIAFYLLEVFLQFSVIYRHWSKNIKNIKDPMYHGLPQKACWFWNHEKAHSFLYFSFKWYFISKERLKHDISNSWSGWFQTLFLKIPKNQFFSNIFLVRLLKIKNELENKYFYFRAAWNFRDIPKTHFWKFPCSSKITYFLSSFLMNLKHLIKTIFENFDFSDFLGIMFEISNFEIANVNLATLIQFKSRYY